MTRGLQSAFVVFCLAVAFAVWAVVYGLALGFVYGDWQVLETTVTADPFLPVRQLWTYPDSRVLQTVALGAAVPSLMIAGLVAFVGLRPPSNPLGDAAFQTPADLRRGRWFGNSGHILGRYGRKLLRVKDDRHHLILGPTRSGKSAGYVIPNALMHEGSMIVTDLKGEIFAQTAGYRKRHGSEVFLFSPGSERTHRYNPLDFVRPGRGQRTTDIQNIARIMIPETAGSDHAVWQAMAQQVLAGAISYVLESDHYRSRRNLGGVNAVFNSGPNPQDRIRQIKAAEPGLSNFTLESFNAYLALPERTAASALLDIQNALRPFKNERVAAATSATDMNLRAMRRRPISIYLAPNITDITLLKPLLTLFVEQAMDILTRDHAPGGIPVYVLLDEFRQLRRMDEIVAKLPYVAGYRIKLAFIVQDLKTLDDIYGEAARHSLLANCGYQLVFGANDQATAEYTARALGKRTIRYQSESRTIELTGLHRRTRVEQIRDRDLMMPQEIRQMPEDKMVLLGEGQRPIFGTKLRFFKTRPFKSAARYSQDNKPQVPVVAYPAPGPVAAMAPGQEERAERGGEPTRTLHEQAQPAREAEHRDAPDAQRDEALQTDPARQQVPRMDEREDHGNER